MSAEHDQAIEQQVQKMLTGTPVLADVFLGIDVDGPNLQQPLVVLNILGSRVVLRIDDTEHGDQWLQIVISEELLARICEAQATAALAEGDGQQPGDEAGHLSIFDAAWDVLAEQGKCDARGSMEYQRVSEGWNSEAWMLAALEFILSQANQMPPENSAS